MEYIRLGYMEPGKFEGMTEDERTQCSTNALSTTAICAPTDILAAFKSLRRDLNHAVQLVSQQPGFKFGLGPIEIRPVADLSETITASEQRRRRKDASRRGRATGDMQGRAGLLEYVEGHVNLRHTFAGGARRPFPPRVGAIKRLSKTMPIVEANKRVLSVKVPVVPESRITGFGSGGRIAPGAGAR
jgi:hypothetical protein